MQPHRGMQCNSRRQRWAAGSTACQLIATVQARQAQGACQQLEVVEQQGAHRQPLHRQAGPLECVCDHKVCR